VAAGRTAAHLLGFDGFDAGPIELAVPRTRRVRSIATIHEVRHLAKIDVVSVGRFPCTSGARTIIDLAASASAEQLAAAIGSALRDGWTSEAFLAKRFAALGGRGRTGTVLLRQVLGGPFGHSELERAFLRLVRKSRLPTPRTQVVIRGQRTVRVDAIWDTERVVVEILGHRWHSTRAQLQRDAQRRNELQALGLLVLEFTSDDIARRPHHVVGQIGRALAHSGDDFARPRIENAARTATVTGRGGKLKA
jgi:very-short-patch-repair endonuclease